MKDFLHQFYTAFHEKDYKTMQQSYHPEAQFYDPVFEHLDSAEVKAMWQMLLTSAKDLRVSFSQVKADTHTGSCRWEAWYTFTATGRSVHNIIDASFEFRDGKIFRHHDTFDLWRWSRQALGQTGVLLGWSPLIQNKIRRSAHQRLNLMMGRQ